MSKLYLLTGKLTRRWIKRRHEESISRSIGQGVRSAALLAVVLVMGASLMWLCETPALMDSLLVRVSSRTNPAVAVASIYSLSDRLLAHVTSAPAADLSITQLDSPDPVAVGNTLVYTITVTNAAGPDTATGVLVTDTLPFSVSFGSASAGCTNSSGTVTCNLPDIASGGNASVTINVIPNTPGTINNAVSVTSDVADPDTSNNSATESTTVSALPHDNPLIYGSAYPTPLTGPGAASLYWIDPTTGAATLVGAIGFNRVGAIAFDPTTGILYGEGIAGSTHVLLSIDRSTGAGTVIGPTGVNSPFQDISFRSDGTLYGYNSDNGITVGKVYTLNLSTGAATLIGATGNFNAGNALAFSRSNVLYTINDLDEETVDQSTGLATTVISMNYGPLGSIPRANGMDFDQATGVLWASVVNGNSSGTRTYYLTTIDATTGTATVIGETVGGLDALAIAPPPTVNAPTVAPTSTSEGSSTAFSVSGTFSDPAGASEQPYTAVINWGDSTTSTAAVSGSANPFSYSFSGNHTYAQSGSYNVTVSITDKDGATGTSAATAVTVANEAPTVSTPTVAPTSTTEGSSTSFTVNGTFTDPAGAADAPFTAVINWGDSTTDTATVTGSGNPFDYSFSGTHTYASSGTYDVTVSVTDKDGGTGTSAAQAVTVNDVAPSGLTYSTNPATYTKGQAITNNTPSSSGGAVTSYGISPALPAGLSFSTSTGVISGTPTVVSAATDYTVTATNSGGFTTATVNITVNDVAPSGLTYSTNPATYTKGQAITNNTPSSSGGAVTSYGISPALPAGLSFSTSTGVISGTPTVVSAATDYTVTATNSGGFTTATVNITVNDVAPSGLTYSTNPATYTKGQAITNNTPSSGGGAVTSYGISPALPAGLSFSTSTGVISGTPTALSAATNYTVTATNSGGFTTATVNITVNDVAPSGLTYSTNPATYTKGQAITNNTPSSGGGAVTSYGISPALPAGLSFSTSTGVISGTPTVLSAATNYTVTATNSGGFTTATVNITVNDVAPSGLTYSTNPATYTKGQAITNNTPSSSGGAVTSYGISPALPAGLSFSTSTGVISGTPTVVSAATNYTVTATNSGGFTTATVNITVNDVAPSGLTYSTNPATYTKGQAITNNTPSSSGGAVTSYGISPALPAGLSFSTSTGVISGTPTVVSAATNYTVTATNSGGFTTATVNITVNDVAPSGLTYSTNPATYTKGQAITNNTPSSGGGAVTSYGISPALPAGLSFSTSTGVISGTPTVVSAATNYTVTATNSGGFTTATVNITVNDVAPSALTYSTNPATYTKGQTITNNTPSSSGGAVTSYSISPSLPAGLSFDTSTGVISGTPTALSPATDYTVTATNSGGFTTATVNITVNDVPPSALTYSTNPATYTKGQTITNNTPSSSGGAVTSYGISPALPAGLSFSTSTGVISGTPTVVSAATNYTVTATNSGGSTTATVNITVNDVAPSGLTYSTNPATYTKGQAITNNTPSSSGGAVTSYGISPALPAGLSFSTSTGVISGTPTALSAATNYTVTATNSGGSTTATVNITVNDVAPSGLTYSTNPATYTKGQAITNNTPSSSGGAVTSYGISPALPAGLSFSTSTGVISGTPTALSAATNYTVTATNSGGSTTATVNLTVNDVAPAGIISFSAADYTVSESGHSVTITVERSGDTTGAATVDYATPDDSNSLVPCATVNGLALSRCDFTTAIGTLKFAAGETTKTFEVLISQDSYVEGSETLPLTLSNLTGGAVFATPSTATLTITDDVPESATNPIDDADNFVRQHYHDFLNREPDAPGLAHWTAEITQCTDPAQRQPGESLALCTERKRANTSAAFFLSPEFQNTGSFIVRVFWGTLGKLENAQCAGLPAGLSGHCRPTYTDYIADMSQVAKGIVVNDHLDPNVINANKHAFVDQFVNTAAFKAKYDL